MRKDVQHNDRPNVDTRYFWDFDYENMDFRKAYKTIIERVIERGTKEDWEELIKFYGREKLMHALKKEIVFLADYAIEDVCNYFLIKKEEMKCYIRKQSRRTHWL